MCTFEDYYGLRHRSCLLGTLGTGRGVCQINAMRCAAFVIGTAHRVRHAARFVGGVDRPPLRFRTETRGNNPIWANLGIKVMPSLTLGSARAAHLSTSATQPSQLADLGILGAGRRFSPPSPPAPCRPVEARTGQITNVHPRSACVFPSHFRFYCNSALHCTRSMLVSDGVPGELSLRESS